MFYPGLTAKYEIRNGFAISHVRTDDTKGQVESAITVIHIGLGCAITIKAFSWFDVGDLSTGNWSIEVSSVGVMPALTYSDSGSGFLDTFVPSVEIDDGDMDVSGCDDTWGWSSNNIRLYINSVLKHTFSAGPYTATGSSYDIRENYFSFEHYPYFGAPGVPEVRLGGSIPVLQPSNTWSLTGIDPYPCGWRYDEGAGWVLPPAALDESFAPTSDACDCSVAPPHVELDLVTPNTWDMIVHLDFEDEVIYTDDGDTFCYCNPADHSIGRPSKWHREHVNDNYLDQRSILKAWPADAGLLSTYRYARQRCTDPQNDPAWESVDFDVYGPTTVSEATTYMAYEKWTWALKAMTPFAEIVTVGSCPVDEGGV